MKIRYEEWVADEKPMLEGDLPPGVRYSSGDTPGAEYIAAEGGSRTVVRFTNGRYSHCHGLFPRDHKQPVAILDWPSWSGPRPVTKTERPKLSEAFKMVGTEGRVAVVSLSRGCGVLTFDAADIQRYGDCVTSYPCCTVLGFLIAEENS